MSTATEKEKRETFWTKTEKETRMKENLASIEIAKQLSKDDVSLIDTLDKNLRKFWDVYDIE